MSRKSVKHWRLAERGAGVEPKDKYRQQTPVDVAEHGGYFVTAVGGTVGPFAIYEDAQAEAGRHGGRVVTAKWMNRETSL